MSPGNGNATGSEICEIRNSSAVVAQPDKIKIFLARLMYFRDRHHQQYPSEPYKEVASPAATHHAYISDWMTMSRDIICLFKMQSDNDIGSI